MIGFLNAGDFPAANLLEDNYDSILAELLALHRGYFTAWPELYLYGSGWDVFGLYYLGKKIDAGCTACPVTASVVESIPGMTTAGFSRMAALTHILPHVGYTDKVLRAHLGLVIPPECTLRVGSETRSWEPGKVLVFDDTVEHEAVNLSLQDRVVLLVDFIRPSG